MFAKILPVFIGGGFGCLARFSVSRIVSFLGVFSFRVSTLFSNISSCIILGLAGGIFSEKIIPGSWLWLLIIPGFCGGFSTFSAFSFETLDLLKSGNISIALVNIFLNLATCMLILFYLLKNSNT